MIEINKICDKDLRKLIKPFIDNEGWVFERIGKHYFFKHPKGGTVTVSKTASDRNAYRKIEKDFIREGKR